MPSKLATTLQSPAEEALVSYFPCIVREGLRTNGESLMNRGPNGSTTGVMERYFVAGMSPCVRTLESVIVEIAPTNIPVLLIGESGTGKAMFAQRVHELSRRANEPLIRIACASMNPATLAIELGLNANGDGEAPKNPAGTVVLDDIAELDAACQRLLLYALPEDGAEPRRGLLMARLVSTASKKLDEEVRAGRFRSELYYRINGVCLRLPPLRERMEDIPLLVELFLTKHAAQLGRPRLTLSSRTLSMFQNHSWPGNIRELENAVKKITALGDEQLMIAELEVAPRESKTLQQDEARGYSLKAAARAASREAERELILKALARTHWNRKRAAQELQISYKSLLYKVKQIGLADGETE
jgi:two-component system, NtrC family, response regulator AtoC